MTRACVLLSLLVVVSAGCQEQPPRDRESRAFYGSPGSWPIERAVADRGRVAIYPVAERSWHTLMDLQVFAGFWAGMTGKEAERALGKADETFNDRGERYWVYSRPGARVIVSHRFKGSLIGGWWWRLEARFDPPLTPSKLLHPGIVQELPKDAQDLTVAVMNDEPAPGAWVYIENGEVVRIDISPQGARQVRLGSPIGDG